MGKREKVIDMISEYLGKHLLLLARLGKNRDNEGLLFKFIFLDTLKEQLEDADEPQIDDLAITAFAAMEIITEEVQEYLENKKR